jgi:hypothetical protein
VDDIPATLSIYGEKTMCIFIGVSDIKQIKTLPDQARSQQNDATAGFRGIAGCP